LECGTPVPLWIGFGNEIANREQWKMESGTGVPHSKTLARNSTRL